MEMLQLRYFYESARTENFSKTAESFCVPTTSVSASVKRLESELGCSLFDRSANRISLNANGRRLQGSLHTVFRELDSVVEALTAQNEDGRQIRLLVRGMRRRITDLITQYSEKNANARFKTVFDYSGTDFRDYDIIIDEENERYGAYQRIELFSMRLRLKCGAGNPLSERRLTLRQLADQPFLVMDLGGNMNRVLTKACSRAGFVPQIAVVCNDIACYEKFISAGMGIGIGRQGNFADGIRDLDVMDFEEHYRLYAYYEEKEYYGKLKSFVEFLRSKGICDSEY